MKKNVFKFIGVGFEITTIVFIFFIVGFEIDKKLRTSFFVIVFSFTGIFISLYTLYKKVKKG